MTLKELELLASRNDAFRFAEAVQLDLDKALAELELLRELVESTETCCSFCSWCSAQRVLMSDYPEHDPDCPWLKWKETYQP